MKKPGISVLITLYNRKEFILSTIESVKNSTFDAWELIIVDDCSSDGSYELVESYVKGDERIHLIQNDTNLGDYSNRNKAASYARGKYLKYLDSDDLIYPHSLQAMYSAMEKYPNAGMGVPFLQYSEECELPVVFSQKDAYYHHFFKGGLLFPGPTGTIILREAFENLDGFSPQNGVASDYAFSLALATQYEIVAYQRDLYWWRPHSGQEFRTKQQDYLIHNYKINLQHLENRDCPLDHGQKKTAVRNQKTYLGRKLLNLLLQFEISRFNSIRKATCISWWSILLSVVPNRLR